MWPGLYQCWCHSQTKFCKLARVLLEQSCGLWYFLRIRSQSAYNLSTHGGYFTFLNILVTNKKLPTSFKVWFPSEPPCFGYDTESAVNFNIIAQVFETRCASDNFGNSRLHSAIGRPQPITKKVIPIHVCELYKIVSIISKYYHDFFS